MGWCENGLKMQKFDFDKIEWIGEVELERWNLCV